MTQSATAQLSPAAFTPSAMALDDALLARARASLSRLPLDIDRLRPSFIASALTRRCISLGLAQTADYLQFIDNVAPGQGEWQQLLHELTVHDSWFFRHPPSLRCLQYLLSEHFSGSQALHLWSVGCANGEETWTLAMVVAESLRIAGTDRHWRLTGSDLSKVCLQQASAGIYRRSQLQSIDSDLRRRYFRNLDPQRMQVADELRRHAGFTQVDITRGGFADAGVHVAYCQNLLIYLADDARRCALENLAASLVPGGFLLLAPGETRDWLPPGLRRLREGGVELFQRKW